MKIKEGGGMDIKEEILAQMDSALRPEFDKAIDNTIEGAFKEDVKTLGFMVANSIKCQWEVMKPHLFYAYCLGVKAQEAKAQAAPEWIGVKDQLPPSDPYNREYWVYETLNNKVQHDYWVCPDTGLDQDFEPFFNNWPRKVTHWMPMVKYPKPPVQAQEPAND